MKGIIGIKSLKIPCIIGNNPDERVKEQEIQVDLRLTTNFAQCVESDRVEDTIDYTSLAAVCSEMAKSKQYHLLETYACELAQRLVEDFEIEWISVRVVKPSAIPEAQHTFVEYECFKEK
jgi:dihydroneopterin aldolase